MYGSLILLEHANYFWHLLDLLFRKREGLEFTKQISPVFYAKEHCAKISDQSIELEL